MQVSINTAVFLEDLQNGQTQSNCVRSLVGRPIDNIEVRGEFFTEDQKSTELQTIAQLCKDNHWGFYYSIPEELFSNDHVNPNIYDALEMANQYDLQGLKISLGNPFDVDQSELAHLKQALASCSATLTVENQPNQNGQMPAFAASVKQLLELIPALGYTFDSGNWYWINDRPEVAFESLNVITTVFHLKDILNQETVMLGDGQTDWQPMVQALAPNVPVFLEYAIAPDQLDGQIELVNQVLANH